MPISGDIKAVNLGCGATFAPGWINLDNSPNARLAKIPGARRLLNWVGVLSDQHLAVNWPTDLIVRDLRKPLPFDDGSIDYIFASHVLEHLSKRNAENMLREAFRVLRPGGVIRIVVPDLAYYSRLYVNELARNPDDSGAASRFLQSLQLSKPGHRDPHLWMYDEPSLTALLLMCGFVDVKTQPFREGQVPDLEILDNRPDDSLRMEGVKPA